MGKLLERFAALSLGVRVGIAVGIAALIGGGYFYWLYLPTAKQLESLKTKRREVEAKVQESKRTAAELPKFKEEVLRLNQELLVALAQLPEEKDIPDLLAQVSRVGQDAGLDVQLFRPGSERPQGLYAAIPVQIRAAGTFHQLLVFFDRVSRLPRIVTVSDISMSDPKETNGRFTLNANFSTTTYRFLPEPASAAPGAAKPGAKGATRAK